MHIHYCDICEVTSNSEISHHIHLQSSGHQKKAKARQTMSFNINPNEKYVGYACTLCNVIFTDRRQLDAHFNGGEHMEKVAPKCTDRNVVEMNGGFKCILCDTFSNSIETLNDHLNGRQHKINMKTKMFNEFRPPRVVANAHANVLSGTPSVPSTNVNNITIIKY